jgi:hypothetical protein
MVEMSYVLFHMHLLVGGFCCWCMYADFFVCFVCEGSRSFDADRIDRGSAFRISQALNLPSAAAEGVVFGCEATGGAGAVTRKPPLHFLLVCLARI